MADARLLVEVAADAAKFHRAMKGVVNESESVRAQAEQMAKASTAAIAAIGVTSAAAVTTMAVQASNDMRELRREAELLGTTAGSLSEWEYAARSVGLEMDKVGDIFKDVNDKIGDFVRTGGGEAADIFEQLGLDAQAFINLSPEQSILRIGSALEGLSQAEKTFFMESLADDASRLLPLLDDNAKRFRTLTEEGRNFGAIVTTEQAKVASGFSDLLKDATNMAGGFKTQLGIGLAPTFEGILNYLEDVTDGLGGPREAAQATALAIVEAMQNSVTGLSSFMSELDTAYEYYLRIRKFQSQVEGFGGTLNNLATGKDEIPQGIIDAQGWQSQINDLQNGGGWGATAKQELESLASHMRATNNQAPPQLNGLVDASGALTLFGESARKTATTFGTASSAAANFAKTLEKFAPSVNQDVESILKQAGPSSTVDETGTLRDAWGNALPTLQRELDAQLKDQLNTFKSERNLQAGLEAAAKSFTGDATTASSQAWSSITPMRAGQFTNSAPPGTAMPNAAPKSRGSVHVTVTKDGNSVSGDVEGDDQFITRLAGALSSTASSV